MMTYKPGGKYSTIDIINELIETLEELRDLNGDDMIDSRLSRINDLKLFETLITEGVKAYHPAAWQWRYVGEERWRTPSGGEKLTEIELVGERRAIEHRPLYALTPKPDYD